jgi:hypothetical protein
MNTKKVVTLLAGIFLALPCSTQAELLGTIDIAYNSNGAGGFANLWGGGLNGTSGYTGVYVLNKSGGTGQGEFWEDGKIYTFCLELSEYAPNFTKTYNVVEPQDAHDPTTFLGETIGTQKAEYINELWGRFFDEAWATSGPFTTQQNNTAKAFAAAIWEIVYEDLPASPLMWNITTDGTEGNRGFYCTGVDNALANNMLHALDGTGPKADLRAFVRNGSQDYIVAVPEPATVCLLTLGGLLLLRRPGPRKHRGLRGNPGR